MQFYWLCPRAYGLSQVLHSCYITMDYTHGNVQNLDIKAVWKQGLSREHPGFGSKRVCLEASSGPHHQPFLIAQVTSQCSSHHTVRLYLHTRHGGNLGFIFSHCIKGENSPQTIFLYITVSVQRRLFPKNFFGHREKGFLEAGWCQRGACPFTFQFVYTF